MTTATDTRIVIVHGPAGAELAATLAGAGLSVLAAGSDTTIWGSPAYDEAPAPEAPRPGVEAALLTISQAAARLGVGRSTVYRLVDSGQLDVVHVGRSVRVPTGAITDLVDRLGRRPRRGASGGSDRDRAAQRWPSGSADEGTPAPVPSSAAPVADCA